MKFGIEKDTVIKYQMSGEDLRCLRKDSLYM